MAGFSASIVYTKMKLAVSKAYTTCKFGMNTSGTSSEFPYVDMSVKDRPGGNYDLENNEGTQAPMIQINVINNQPTSDTVSEKISLTAKQSMLAMGFRCTYGPAKIENVTNTNLTTWVARYTRLFGNGESIS